MTGEQRLSDLQAKYQQLKAQFDQADLSLIPPTRLGDLMLKFLAAIKRESDALEKAKKPSPPDPDPKPRKKKHTPTPRPVRPVHRYRGKRRNRHTVPPSSLAGRPALPPGHKRELAAGAKPRAASLGRESRRQRITRP